MMRWPLVLAVVAGLGLGGGALAEPWEGFHVDSATQQCVRGPSPGVLMGVMTAAGSAALLREVSIPGGHKGGMVVRATDALTIWETERACRVYRRDAVARARIAAEERESVADVAAWAAAGQSQATRPPWGGLSIAERQRAGRELGEMIARSDAERAQRPRWWTTAGNGSRCIESSWSPAERIEEIRGNRREADVREYDAAGVREFRPSGAPASVEVSDGEWEWRYFRTQAVCERHIASLRVPDRLR